MSRLLRSALTLLVAVALALVANVAPAYAQELGPAPEAARTPAAPAGPVLSLPSDVPLVSPGQVEIPPVPAGFVTRDLGWLTLSYPSAASERVARVIESAASVRSELANAFGQDVLGHVEVRVVQNVSEMTRLAPVGAPPPAYAEGVAYPRLRLALVSMMATRGGEAVDVDRVFRHELLHLALEDATAGRHVPAWFNEGLAVLFADENGLDRQRVLFNATVSGTLLPLSDLDRGFPSNHFDVNIAYAESADFVGFLRRRSDDLRFTSMIKRVRDGQPFERALGTAYGSDLRKLEFQWRGDLERRYSVIPILAGGGVIWVGVIGALGWGWHKKRRRAKAILARWAEEEAIEDALLAQRAAEGREEAELDVARLSVPRSPAKVEHAGRFHTLH